VASTRCLAEPLSLILGASNTNACSGDRRKYNALLRVLYDITDNPLAHASSASIFAPQTGVARMARGSGESSVKTTKIGLKAHRMKGRLTAHFTLFVSYLDDSAACGEP